MRDAAFWFVRLRFEKPSARDLNEFESWLAVSGNAEAFRREERLMRRIEEAHRLGYLRVTRIAH